MLLVAIIYSCFPSHQKKKKKRSQKHPRRPQVLLHTGSSDVKNWDQWEPIMKNGWNFRPFLNRRLHALNVPAALQAGKTVFSSSGSWNNRQNKRDIWCSQYAGHFSVVLKLPLVVFICCMVYVSIKMNYVEFKINPCQQNVFIFFTIFVLFILEVQM